MVEAPRLHADVGGRFDCAHASASSSIVELVLVTTPLPVPVPVPPTPTGLGATGSCALVDQPSLSIVLGATAPPPLPAPLLQPPSPPLPPPSPPTLPQLPPAESSPEAAGTLGPCEAEGALPPTAAAHPPTLDEPSVISVSAAGVSVQPLSGLDCSG